MQEGQEQHHESFKSPQDSRCPQGHCRREKLRKARQKEGAVAGVRTEEASREFSAVSMLFDTIKQAFIFVF